MLYFIGTRGKKKMWMRNDMWTKNKNKTKNIREFIKKAILLGVITTIAIILYFVPILTETPTAHRCLGLLRNFSSIPFVCFLKQSFV